MQMISSVLENPVWRWWRRLQKQCVFDDIFLWTKHPRTLALSHTHTHQTHTHPHTPTHTQIHLRWLKLWLPEAAIAVNQALFSVSVQSRQIDRKAWCHQFRKRESPFYIPRCNSTQRGRRFIRWEIETESNNTILCGRQNEASTSHLSFITRQRQKKRRNRRREGRTKKEIAILKPL